MKVLITAASKHGATAEIADAIAETLDAAGHDVVRVRPEQVDSLDGIDAAVIGSAVYAGHWMPEVKDLIARHADGLRSCQVWLFSSGPIGAPAKPDGDPVDVPELMAATGAQAHVVFSGRLDKGLLSIGERAMVMALRAPMGDFRDWRAIRAWGEEIAQVLRSGEPMIGATV